MTAPLIACRDVAKAYGDMTLFSGISLNVEEGDRLGIIGPNGAGKSTLLRVMAKKDAPDEGDVIWRRELRIAMVEQDLELELDRSVEEVIAEAAQRAGPLHALEEDAERGAREASVLDRLGFRESDVLVSTLSGGWLKRLAIARALVTSPELLLLDEPTNHLDLEGIEWLEKHLGAHRTALVVVSHDRAFLEAVVHRVAEIDRRYPGGLFLVGGSYSTFRERREELLAGQSREELSLASKVRREVEWLRQGPKARTHKSKNRLETARRLMEELAELKHRTRETEQRIEFSSTGRRSKRLLLAVELSKSLGGKQLFSKLSMLLRPGMRVGLVGDNGSGKTTLLRLLAGELRPDEGFVERLEHLEVVYFDQHKEELDPSVTLRRTLAPEGDSVVFQGRSLHVVSWARRFRFHSDQLDLPLGELSGGERAKAMIARLLLRRADVLLLDEPTNDLDIPTLEVLEESLLDFPGAVVIVTHDRYVLDRVTTVLLALGGPHDEATFYADYTQWSAAREAEAAASKQATRRQAPAKQKPRSSGGLTYLEQKEYLGMESAILEAEAALEEASVALDEPAIAADAERLNQCYERHAEARKAVEALYARWAELEDKSKR